MRPDIARLRAIETSRWLTHPTMRGGAVVIDPRGAVLASMPPSEAGVLTGEAHRLTGDTLCSAIGAAWGPRTSRLALITALEPRLRRNLRN